MQSGADTQMAWGMQTRRCPERAGLSISRWNHNVIMLKTVGSGRDVGKSDRGFWLWNSTYEGRVQKGRNGKGCEPDRSEDQYFGA